MEAKRVVIFDTNEPNGEGEGGGESGRASEEEEKQGSSILLEGGEGEEERGEEEEEEEEGEDLERSAFGSRRATQDVSKRLSISIQQAWWRPTVLPDLAYVVKKVNQFGKRQTRTLRLSSEGIENMRKNGKVSSLYPYEAVLRVYMKNMKAFIIDYRNAKHSYQYRSPVAMHIVQEITSRLVLRRQEERFLTPDIATRLQERLMGQKKQQNQKPQKHRSPCPRIQSERRLYQAKKLLNIFGSTEQQRLENTITTIILDEGRTEGRTLKQFCNNFAVLEKNPATLLMNVRQFMDDLRSFLMERHAEELAKLTVEASSQPLVNEELSLSSIVELAIERALISRFRDRIVASLKRPAKEEEMRLKRVIAFASTKSQQFFDVDPEFVSLSGWVEAIAELQVLDHWDLPHRLLTAIVATAKSIYATLNEEKNRNNPSGQQTPIFLSADDFFPIFLYVFARAQLKNPQLVSQYLWGLCDPEQLSGEGGYYLTVFCSAFEYLKLTNFDQESREENFNNQILPEQNPEINSSRSVDSYFTPAQSAEERRERTTSAPQEGEKSKSAIYLLDRKLQSLEGNVGSDQSAAKPPIGRRIVIGSSDFRVLQDGTDDKKEAEAETGKSTVQGSAWPLTGVRPSGFSSLRLNRRTYVRRDSFDDIIEQKTEKRLSSSHQIQRRGKEAIARSPVTQEEE